jgi:hypothetical protein
MPDSLDLKIVLDVPCLELVTADIDVTEYLVRFECSDTGRIFSGSHPLQPADIAVLNEGGVIILRDRTGHEIALRL